MRNFHPSGGQTSLNFGENAIFRLTPLLLSNNLLLIMDFRRSGEGTLMNQQDIVPCEKGNNLYRSLSEFTPLRWSQALCCLVSNTGSHREQVFVNSVIPAIIRRRPRDLRKKRVPGISYLTPILPHLLHHGGTGSVHLENWFGFFFSYKI